MALIPILMPTLTAMDDFMIRAALAGIGASLLAAPLGSFVVWRRMIYFGETIAYSGLLGVALGILLGLDLTFGVLATALAMALLLIGVQTRQFLPQDTLLGILAHSALAAGLIFTSFLKGVRLDLMGYLFGDVLAVSATDLYWIWGAVVCVGGCLYWLWRPLLAVTLHEELAAAEGVPVRRVESAFILLIAVVVALTMKIIGIFLITSLMIFPTAIARTFAKTPEQMAAIGAGVAALAVVGGLFASFHYDIPAGPSIVATLAILFFGVAVPIVQLRRA